MPSANHGMAFWLGRYGLFVHMVARLELRGYTKVVTGKRPEGLSRRLAAKAARLFGRTTRARIGCAERCLWRRQIRFQRSRRGPLESDRAAALRARHRRGRSQARRGRRALRRDRPSHRPLAEGQAHRRRRSHARFGVVGRQSQDDAREFRRAARRFPGALQRQEAVRAGSLRRRRSEISDQDPRLHRTRLAFAVHPPVADPARARRSRQVRARTHHRRSAVVQARRQASRRPRRLRHHGGDRFHPQDRADLRLVLRRRDEEVGVHHAQLLSAGRERHADALLGQCQP